MTTVFITATGTDIGKTYLTAALIRHLRRQGADTVVGFPNFSIGCLDAGKALAVPAKFFHALIQEHVRAARLQILHGLFHE